jgi:hypothetical protein
MPTNCRLRSRNTSGRMCLSQYSYPYLSLLNEIDRVGKKEVDELIRSRRLRMKLIISSSLGQAWLINHPSCRMDTSTHSVFFTETPNDLDQLVIDAIDRLMTGGAGINHEHDAFATLTPREMRTKRREKERQTPTDQSKGQDMGAANQSDQSESEKDDNADDSPSPIDRSSNECQRTINHPLHTISTSPKPLPIDK